MIYPTKNKESGRGQKEKKKCPLKKCLIQENWYACLNHLFVITLSVILD